MKFIAIAILALLFSFATAWADISRTLAWDASPVREGVVKYRIYQLQPNKSWAVIATVFQMTYPKYVVRISHTGVYNWRVTAVNVAGIESQPSHIVTHFQYSKP